MTWLMVSVSGNIPGIFWDKHNQMSFPWKNVLCISDLHQISTVVHLDSPLYTIIYHRTDLVQIPGQWESPATCCHMQQDSSSVECARWLLVISFWLEADYIFLRTSYFFLLSFSSAISHKQILATPTSQPGESGSESSWSTGASSRASLPGSQQQSQPQLIQRDAANPATVTMTQVSHI